MLDFDATMQRAGRKLNFAKNSLMGKNGSIRNNDGFQLTCSRITSSLENFMNSGFSSSHYGLDEALNAGLQRSMNFSRRNFSSTDLQTVQDCDVVDISIAATIASHALTYIAMERPMESVRQEISFQGLKALNDVNGYSKGDVVFDPRLAISSQLDLGQSSGLIDSSVEADAKTGMSDSASTLVSGFNPTAAVDLLATLDSPVILGTTKLVVKATDNAATPVTHEKVIAFDPKANEVPSSGIVSLVMNAGSLLSSASVNIETGKVTLNFAPAIKGGANAAAQAAAINAALEDIFAAELGAASVVSSSIEAVTCVDRVAEENGSHTMKLTPFVDSKTLVSQENRIVLQSSVEVQAQMNKILRKNAQYGIDTDFGKRAIDQIIALYTYYIDTNIIKALWNGIPHTTNITLDLSGFGEHDAWGYNANVKNDAIGLFVNDLCQEMLNVTGQPVTALIVDDVGARMLASDKESFVPDPAFLQRRDGFIGNYNNIPVVRNFWLHDKAGAGKGVVIGVFKSPDGQAAPVAFGDYLPPYSTIPALNPQNPGELSQALFSSTATSCVVPGWAVLGTINPYARHI